MVRVPPSGDPRAAAQEHGVEPERPRETEAQIVTFRSGYHAEIRRGRSEESLTLRTRDGQLMLAIEMTDRGPLLRLSGGALQISAASTLSLEASHLELSAESATVDVRGDLVERVGGDASREVAGGASLLARDIALQATRGGVAVKANDDVDLDGERVRLNCDPAPMPLSWDEFRQRQRAFAAAGEPVLEAPGSGDDDSPELPDRS
jgi:hypothetical protein